MRSIGLIAILLCTVAAGAAETPGDKMTTKDAKIKREFFAFDNGLGGIKTPKEKVAVLKELGYAGIGSRSGRVASLLPELDAAGLKMSSSYVRVNIKDGAVEYDSRLPEEIELMKGRGTIIWLLIKGGSNADQDDVVVAKVREVSDMAKKSGLQVSLYPHKGCYVATALDSLRIAEKVDRPNVGASFNLCHFLTQNNVDDLESVVRKVAPRMNLVSINGADNGSKLPLGEALQRLDKGTFDNSKLLKLLDEVGYKGPIGLQCFSIKGDDKENLTASMNAWKKINSRNRKTGNSK